MTFLQPWMLAALPLVALPLIIHLVNQRRFETVQWAATMFLISARALSRGYSRLRYWLVMLLRMLAVAAVILAVGRPLSRGWLGLAAGRSDTAVAILDTSPSMQARDPRKGESKLDTARRQLSEALATLAPAHCLVITDAGRPPQELADPRGLVELPQAAASAAPADIPRALQVAYEHIRDNAVGSAEIWICSDQRANDWAAEDGGWPGLREAFAELPQPVRFQLLSFPQPAAGDLAVRVTDARLERRQRESHLLLDVAVSRQEEGPDRTVPLKVEIGGAATVVDVALTGRETVLRNHVVPLGADQDRGWGRVSLPPDADPADDEFFFVYAEPPARRTIVVAEDPETARILGLVAGIPPQQDRTATVEVVSAEGFATAAWEAAALVLWQAPLPTGDAAAVLSAVLGRGGQAIFLPPASPTGTTFAGGRWTTWTTHEPPRLPETWQTDEDLLANTESGGPLPLGAVEVRRTCGIAGDVLPLAALDGGAALVVRAPAVGGVTFLCTGVSAGDSSLAAEGVVLYALVNRALDRGSAGLGGALQRDAGAVPAAGDEAAWTRLAGAGGPLGREAGVYAVGERLVAFNRPAAEDAAEPLTDGRVDELFGGLPFTRLEEQAGGGGRLVREIWRGFLIAMLLALVGEGLLSLPRRPDQPRLPVAGGLEAAV